MRKKSVRILVAVFPFLLGSALTYALGVGDFVTAAKLGEPVNGSGFPFAWSYTEMNYLYTVLPAGVDFLAFLLDLLFWSALFAAALWFAYYVYS